jgi:hypothetical protein
MSVVSKLNFDDKYWRGGRALVNIFFSDWKVVRADSAYGEDLAAEVQRALDDPTGRRINRVVLPSLLGEFNRCVEKIISYSPRITGELQLAPMVWMKVAIQLSSTDSPIANTFIRRYRAWRDKHQQQGVIALVEKIKRNDETVKSKSQIENSNLTTYPLDVFLLTDLDDYISQEFTLKVKYIKINNGENNVGNVIVNTQLMQSPKKSLENRVGNNVYSDILRLVELAAERKLIKGELWRTVEGRYCYSGYRQDLLDSLRRLFPHELKRGDDGYKKAISKIVVYIRKKNLRK